MFHKMILNPAFIFPGISTEREMQQKGMLPVSCPSLNHSKSASKLTLPLGFVSFWFYM